MEPAGSLTLTYRARTESAARAAATVDSDRLALQGLVPARSSWSAGRSGAAGFMAFGVFGLLLAKTGELTVTYVPASMLPATTPDAEAHTVATTRCLACQRRYAAVMDRCPYCGAPA
jgi:hypothetical protein